VVSVCVRVQRVHELQAELAQELDVALELIDDGIDQHSLSGLLASKKIRVGPGLVIEELTK